MKPKVIITGCSGFVGTHLCRAMVENFDVYGLDVAEPSFDDESFKFSKVDLRKKSEIESFFNDFDSECCGLINLAAYYDFSNEPSDNYSKLIECLPVLFDKFLSVKSKDAKFIQASSMAAIKPCLPGEKITSGGERLAPWKYPEFKVQCENTLRKLSKDTNYVEAVLAAIYSDYAELVPLYQLLMVQKNFGINRFFYPGKLDRGLTYLHIDDAVKFFIHLLGVKNPPKRVLVGENEAYPHGEIFKACDKFLYGFSIPKIPVPKFAAKIGAKVLLKLNPEEFIHPWMINLSDEYFSFEMNETKESTGWQAEQYIGENINKILKHMKDDEGEFTKKNTVRPWRGDHWKQL